MSLTTNKDFLSEQSYELFEASTMPFSNQSISHFALADSLLTYTGVHQKPLLHFWPTANLVFLGMLDTKLPHFKEGLEVFRKHQTDFIVRNSGGLAVVGDEGVLNFSLILPETTENRMSIDEGYAYMFRLVNAAFKGYGKTIEAYEIADSYCPGEFDLSIDGKKFAGIAQRRLRNGVAIMIYLSVNGNQEERGRMIAEFYDAGLKDESVKWTFPKVNPASMANLEDLLEAPLTVELVKEKIMQVLLERGCTLTKGTYSEEITQMYESSFQKMIRRNLQMLGEHADRELLK